MRFTQFQQYPFDIPTEAFPFEIFKQAFVAVQSCVVHLQVLLLTCLSKYTFYLIATFILLILLNFRFNCIQKFLGQISASVI